MFVAGFIGTPPMNMIECHLTEADELSDKEGHFKISNGRIQKLRSQMAAATADLIFGIRAEDVTLTAQPDEGQVRGEVMVREPLGDETIYEVEVGHNIILVKTEPTTLFAPGDPVGLNFSEGRMHVFDAQNEGRDFDIICP